MNLDLLIWQFLNVASIIPLGLLIHMMPEETVQACLDLKSKVVLPVHWGKFALANHPWNEPIKRLVESATKQSVKIAHPMIGEPVTISKSSTNREQNYTNKNGGKFHAHHLTLRLLNYYRFLPKYSTRN